MSASLEDRICQCFRNPGTFSIKSALGWSMRVASIMENMACPLMSSSPFFSPARLKLWHGKPAVMMSGFFHVWHSARRFSSLPVWKVVSGLRCAHVFATCLSMSVPHAHRMPACAAPSEKPPIPANRLPTDSLFIG